MVVEWFFRASTEITKNEIGSTGHFKQALPGYLRDRLNIDSKEFLNESPSVELTARYSMLVFAVTAYEDYLTDVLKKFLYKYWKETDTYSIKFIPKELPKEGGILEFLKEKAIDKKIQLIISEKYETRHRSISKLIKNFSGKVPSLPEEAIKLSASACVARNCIVHSAGNIDERGEQSLKEFVPEIKVGEPFVLEEAFLWKLLGALRDSARSIDVLLR